MKNLQKYREQIRQIQVDPDSVNDSGFPFEVPALIRVGTTVTAFHKKSKILHRGTVLLRNSRSNHYLIQFERKELGCEYCPDIEVACHGVPEIIKPSVKLSLDGANIGIIRDHYTKPGVLPYGTTYGLITGMSIKIILSEFVTDQSFSSFYPHCITCLLLWQFFERKSLYKRDCFFTR